MHRLIIIAMLAFAAIAASAQTVIEGTVADAQGKHVEAYVSVAPKGTGNILVLPTPTPRATTGWSLPPRPTP